MRVLRYLCLAIPLALSVCTLGHSQERVFSEYQYDEVGNTTQTVRDLSGAPPRIDSVSPSIVRQNQSVNLLINGEGLRGAQLQNAEGVFEFRNVVTTNNTITTTLVVDQDAEQGPSQISISTSLGVEFFSLEVLAELPELRISPIPLVLQTGSSSSLSISLSTRDVLDHQVSVSIADTSIANLNVSAFSFSQGSLTPDADIQISALSAGRTALTFDSLTLGQYTYTLTVTDNEFELTPGSIETFRSNALGINKLFVPTPRLIDRGSVLDIVTINKQFTVPVVENQLSDFTQLGIVRGNYHLAPQPKAVGAGANAQTVIVEGGGLSDVVSVAITPDDNITVNNLNINAQGDSLSFDVSVADDTPLALRKLELQTATGVVSPLSASANRIYIGGTVPTIISLSPIYLNRGDLRTIIVRGFNFESVRGIRFDNNDNLTFSEPTISPDGRSLSFDIVVQGFARLGPRQLILESLVGDSVPINPSANLINIENEPPRVLSPIVSAVVGITKEVATQPQSTQQTARSNVLGIARGSLLRSIAPSSRSQGSEVVLNITGFGLNNVVNAEFLPAQGITVNELNVSGDGNSATLNISIASDAEATIRQLSLLTASSTVPATTSADRFTVTFAQPQIDSVLPRLIDRSQGTASITVRGSLLNNASLITLIPSEGITASAPVVSADGNTATATLTVAPDAALGSRVIQITTPSGSTESAPFVGNTVEVVRETQIIPSVLSAQLGIVREVTLPPVTVNQSAFTNSVGIIKQVAPETQTRDELAFSNQLGITKGPSVFSISPTRLPINSVNQTIEVTGFNLDDVTTVQTTPADGVVLNGPAIISADGTRVTFTATVDEDAPQTARRLELLTADGTIPYVSEQNSQLRITNLLPEIDFIDPIQQVRGASFTMTIRGINLGEVVSVQAFPANGIQFLEPTLQAGGSILTVPVTVSPTAPAEQKVITVTTVAGTSINIAMPANTFTIISE